MQNFDFDTYCPSVWYHQRLHTQTTQNTSCCSSSRSLLSPSPVKPAVAPPEKRTAADGIPSAACSACCRHLLQSPLFPFLLPYAQEVRTQKAKFVNYIILSADFHSSYVRLGLLKFILFDSGYIIILIFVWFSFLIVVKIRPEFRTNLHPKAKTNYYLIIQ